jgi:hypothetical protein
MAVTSRSAVSNSLPVRMATLAIPKPALDTSALDAELTLVDLTDSPVLPTYVTESEFARSWFVVAALDGTDLTGSFWIATDKPSGGRPQMYLGTASEPREYLGTGMSTGVDDAVAIGYSNEGVLAIGALPAATSVVAAAVDDGTALWQRPVGGLAVFEATACWHGLVTTARRSCSGVCWSRRSRSCWSRRSRS